MPQCPHSIWKIKESKEKVIYSFKHIIVSGSNRGHSLSVANWWGWKNRCAPEYVSQCRESLLGDKITGNGSHLQKKKKKTKCWFVIFFSGCFRISIFRWISHLCEFMKGKLWLPVFFSQAIHSVFHFTSLKWFHSVREMLYAILVLTQGVNCQGGWDLGVWITSTLYCFLHILLNKIKFGR